MNDIGNAHTIAIPFNPVGFGSREASIVTVIFMPARAPLAKPTPIYLAGTTKSFAAPLLKLLISEVRPDVIDDSAEVASPLIPDPMEPNNPPLFLAVAVADAALPINQLVPVI